MAKKQKSSKTETSESIRVAISSQGKAPLSKKQEEFNRLTKKIERLRKDIAEAGERNEFLMKAMHDYYIPAVEDLAKAKITLAMALEEGCLNNKFSKTQKEKVGLCIVDICSQAFEFIVPSEEEKALFNRWSENTYEQELEWQQEDEKEEIESRLKEVLGIEIDLDELQENPEKMAEIQEEFLRKANENPGGQGKQAKRKTKAQRKKEAAKEAKRKAAEEMKSKSIRSIFISLAKLIHPDTEKDPEQRAAKEEEMKKLSEAYEKNDLTTLLAMELAWIHKQNDHLASLPESKLDLYVEVLKDQVRDLEEEKVSLRFDPRYTMIFDYNGSKKETGLRQIKEDARELNRAVLDFKRKARSLEGKDARKRVMEFVEDYLEPEFSYDFF